jgi:hypothetical protein
MRPASLGSILAKGTPTFRGDKAGAVGLGATGGDSKLHDSPDTGDSSTIYKVVK